MPIINLVCMLFVSDHQLNKMKKLFGGEQLAKFLHSSDRIK